MSFWNQLTTPMEIKFFCPRWGSEHLGFHDFAKKVTEAGYDGVEMSLPAEKKEKELTLQSLKAHQLLYIAQHWETASVDFEEHRKEYRQRLEHLASAQPLLINSQTGKDFFTFEQNEALISIAREISQRTGIQIVHETHRGKFSFAAHVTASYVARIPDLRIGFDVSHWCCVAESMLENQTAAVDLAISHADHLHARVGFPGGPQVPDPRTPEWKEVVDIHLGWWDRIIERNRKEGKTLFTITPEFGPYPYMTILPFTRQPIAPQWELNVYMMEMLRARYG
jgi:hypothetical protein